MTDTNGGRFSRCGAAGLLSLALLPMRGAGSSPVSLPPMQHPADVVAFRNETMWSYSRDPVTLRQVHQRRDPPPEYTLRCFVLARLVKLFHAHARFEASSPPLGDGELRSRLQRLLKCDSRAISPDADRVVFPGFATLHALSVAEERVFKEEAGGAWRSYFQRGHWRMILPFTRSGQAKEAARLVNAVRANRAPVLHVLTFPTLTLNHAVVLLSAVETSARIEFRAYDPNEPEAVLDLVFDRTERSFKLPPTAYFVGGLINAYEVYCGVLR